MHRRPNARARAARFACCLVALFAAVTPSAAQADVEPNDLLIQAEGPLLGGTHTGVVANLNDWDWYSFYVASQTQMVITVTEMTPPERSACGLEFNLRDANGEHIESISALDTGESRTIRYTTPVGTTQYMVDFASPCSNTDMTDTRPASYSLDLSPSPAFLQGPVTAVGFGTPTGEPNESATQPFGPLLGNQGFSGASETSNDEDWFYLYSAGRRAIDVAIYNTNVGFAHDCNPALTAFGDRRAGFAQPLWQHVSHVTLRPRAAGSRFYLQVADPCGSSTYQLRVSPPSAVTSSVKGPSLKSGRCLSAEANHLNASARLKRTLGRLKRAHTRAAKRRLRRRAATQRRQLKRARRTAVRRCG